MFLLRIQHPVLDFERWRMAFDSDPLDRRASGVSNYALYRGTADDSFVGIDLEFTTLADAQLMLQRLQGMWASGPAGVAAPADTWILESVDRVNLG